MSVKIDSTEYEGISILEIEGELELGEPVVSLRQKVQHLLHRGARRLVIDLRKTTKLDTAGIAELCNCWKTVETGGGSMKLVFHAAGRAPSNSCITSAVFDPVADWAEWYSSVDEAVCSFDA